MQDLIPEKVRSALDLVGLTGFEERRAVTLSGGEMQRVALARAMVTEPEVLLLDEPTANLDPVSSELIEDLILRINKEFRTTIIMSTHDMIQGQRLADRIGVIMDGRLVQTGTAVEIFYQPKGRDIARFVGIDPITGRRCHREHRGACNHPGRECLLRSADRSPERAGMWHSISGRKRLP